MSMLDQNYHYWFSQKLQDQLIQDNEWENNGCGGGGNRHLYTIINGEEVEYNCCAAKNEHGCSWDDMLYLGEGRFSRTGENL